MVSCEREERICYLQCHQSEPTGGHDSIYCALVREGDTRESHFARRRASPYALQKLQCEARTAGSTSRRSAASKVIHGHNEDFWPLDTSHTGSRLQQSLQDTRDIVLSSNELDFGQSEMSRKIARDKMIIRLLEGPGGSHKKTPLEHRLQGQIRQWIEISAGSEALAN